MLKAPVNKGSRAFPAGAKGRRRFTSLSQTRCETFVKRQKREKGLGSPVNRGLWKWKRFFETHTRAHVTPMRDHYSCTEEWLSHIREWLIQLRDSHSHRKVVPLLEKPYDFLESPTTFLQEWLSHTWLWLSRTQECLSRPLPTIITVEVYLIFIFLTEITIVLLFFLGKEIMGN